MKYEVNVSDKELYTIHAPGVTSEAQLIWLALNDAGWADHPYTVSREDDAIRIQSERLQSALTIKPQR
jgi:hypothetical protein